MKTQYYRNMATPRSGKNITVPDAHLLDDDNSGDEVVVPEDYENMFDNADQPGGKISESDNPDNLTPKGHRQLHHPEPHILKTRQQRTPS